MGKRIEIKTEKVVVKGVIKRKILSVSALTEKELPREYINKGLHCYLRISSVTLPEIYTSEGCYCREGDCYVEEKFQGILTCIKEAGERLHEIMKRVRQLEKEWVGEETFII